MWKQFFSITCLTVILSLNANAQIIDLKNTAIISTHISPFWDINNISFKAAKVVEELAMDKGISFVDLFSPDDVSVSPFKNESIIKEVSHAGEHLLNNEFKSVISLGGYPGACLANSMRDTLRMFLDQSDSKNTIIIITDAVFGSTALSKIFPKETKKLERQGRMDYTLNDILEAGSNNNSKKLERMLSKYIQFKNLDQKEFYELLNQFEISLFYKSSVLGNKKATSSIRKLNINFMTAADFQMMLK